MKILEVNNIDIVGKRFNGYEMAEYIRKNTNNSAEQLVNFIMTNDSEAKALYNNLAQFEFEQRISELESKKLSTHSQLSISSKFLEYHKLFKEASLAHFHMYHNSKFDLQSLKNFSNKKPTIISFHDMWFLTGRCVQPFECNEWIRGCQKCHYLNTEFPMYIDNCNELWKLKRKIFEEIDVDIVVHSKYMYDAVKSQKIIDTKKLHLIPFGLDLKKFYDNGKKDEIKKKLKIPKDNIVMFFRAQNEFKGTEYIVEAMKLLKTDKNITLISCDKTNLLDSLKDKYNIIDMGLVKTKTLIDCYRVCDIFLMPSKGESFGFMAIEAMACSRPVIVFDNTALPSITFAPECGILVENKNSEKLKNAIEKLILNEIERNKRGELGRKLSEKYYDIDVYNKKMLSLYKKVLKRKHKKLKNHNYIIDYNDIEAQKILKKLFTISRELFGVIPIEFNGLFKNINKQKSKGKIKYSNTNVQEIIKIYNNLLYIMAKKGKIQKKDKLTYIIKRKISTFIFLLKYDKVKLRKVIKSYLKIGK